MIFRQLAGSELYCPHFLIVELFDKKERILKYSKLTTSDISELYYQILKRITFVNEALIADESLQEAYDLVADIDLKDLPFVALAIQTQIPLWTGDRVLTDGLRAKGFELLKTTSELP